MKVKEDFLIMALSRLGMVKVSIFGRILGLETSL
jgi:hypothetical protein